MGKKFASKFYAFTARAKGRANELATEIGVSLPFKSEDEERPQNILLNKKAIWDTGAQCTVISPSISKELKLIPSGKVEVHGVNSKILSNKYVVNLFLPNGIIIPYVEVAESDIGCDVLVGMDIITLGDFTITNKNNITVFTFRVPSYKEVDYVKESNKLNFPNVGRNDPCPCGSGKKFKKCHGSTI